jgi:hypothetical protein
MNHSLYPLTFSSLPPTIFENNQQINFLIFPDLLTSLNLYVISLPVNYGDIL